MHDPALTRHEEYISKKNRDKAKQHFNLQPGFVLHHKDPTLRHNNVARYIEWRIEDLEVMSNEEHTRFHNYKRDPEINKKISKTLTGRKLSEETKAKIAAGARRRYEDPEEHKKTSEAMKAAYAH